MTLLAWCVAWILDVVIGDPPHWPHPVRWIGRLITASAWCGVSAIAIGRCVSAAG